MVGTLYMVKNILNNKVYIGKTYLNIDNRIRRHITDAKREDRHKCKFHRALNKYGLNNFVIERIGEYKQGELEDKEIHYIKMYDSYKNGYNSTLGGDGGSILEFRITDMQQMCTDYNEGRTLNSIANEFDISMHTVVRVLISNNIILRHDTNIEIVMYDTYWNEIDTFESKAEAKRYIEDETEKVISNRDFYRAVKKSCENGNIAYGYKWQILNGLTVVNNKGNIIRFNTLFDKADFLDGQEVRNIGNRYWEVNRYIKSLIENNKGIIQGVCRDCGKDVGRQSSLCVECAHRARRVVDRPTANELERLIQTYSYEHLGRAYGVSGKTIRKWCDTYKIKKPLM